jgi:hypothetical protein
MFLKRPLVFFAFLFLADILGILSEKFIIPLGGITNVFGGIIVGVILGAIAVWEAEWHRGF